MKAIGTRIRPIPLLVLMLGLAATLPPYAEATLRKCSGPAGSARPAVAETPLLMIDGVVVGDAKSHTGSEGELWYSTPAGKVTVSVDQIEFLVISCLAHEVDGQWVTRGVISVGTKEGMEGMVRRHLAELLEVQEGYRRANGAYAKVGDLVGFWFARHQFALEMRVVDGGWSARAAATMTSRRVCTIAVGTATRPGAVSGEVECFDKPEVTASAPGSR